MKKLTELVYIARTTTLLSLIISLGLLSSPLPSIADREESYRNCSELQKRLNERNNPRKIYKGFEKVRIVRRSLDYEAYIVFCNGGILINRELGTICRGYIAYSFERIPSSGEYYSRWGRTEGLPNDGDIGIENYCRWME